MAAVAPDFHWFAPDLAVGGSLPAVRPAGVLRRHGLGAVVDLREEACDDEADLQRLGVEFLHLPTPDRLGVSQVMLDAGVAFAHRMSLEDRRLLIHCREGVGRSATLALCVLVDRGAAPLEALRLAKRMRPVVSPSEAQYLAWARWLGRNGHTPPSFHEFGCIAYAQLVEASDFPDGEAPWAG